MKRLIATVAAILAGLTIAFGAALLLPIEASAAFNPFEQACTQGGGGPACNTNTQANPLLGQQGLLSRVISILSLILGVVAVIFLIWGGVKYVMSNGDSSAISTAKQTIIYALVGLVLAVLARPIINTVLSRI